MIKKPEDFDLGEKKIRMLLAGPPGIGKSTLAMSAPAPLLIDTDGGFDRVEFMYRKDRLVANSYQEILDDLQPQNLKEYQTLVIDTAGRMQSYMSAWAIEGKSTSLHFRTIKNYTMEQKKALMLRVLKNRLGLKGKEFRTARLHLTAAFGGNAEDAAA